MTHPSPTPGEAADACTGCPIAPSRRDFLRDASVAVAAVLVGLGLDSRRAFAEPLRLIQPLLDDAKAARMKTYAIPAKDGVEIDRGNELILVRSAGAVYAFALSCPHQNTALRWDEKHSRFECPKHHSKYTPSGAFIDGRATRGMDRYEISRAGETITVNLDAVVEQDKQATRWNAAVVKI